MNICKKYSRLNFVWLDNVVVGAAMVVVSVAGNWLQQDLIYFKARYNVQFGVQFGVLLGIVLGTRCKLDILFYTVNG